MTGVEGLRGDNAIRRQQASALVAGSPRYNPPVRINAGGRARVGITQDPTIVLDGPHPRLIQVLARGAVVSVPAVIRDVDEHLRAVCRKFANFIRKDGFIADKNAEAFVAGIEHSTCRPRAEFSHLARQVFREEEERFIRNVFPKRNQMDLVVVANQPTTRPYHSSAVGDLGRCRAVAWNYSHIPGHTIATFSAT